MVFLMCHTIQVIVGNVYRSIVVREIGGQKLSLHLAHGGGGDGVRCGSTGSGISASGIGGRGGIFFKDVGMEPECNDILNVFLDLFTEWTANTQMQPQPGPNGPRAYGPWAGPWDPYGQTPGRGGTCKIPEKTKIPMK